MFEKLKRLYSGYFIFERRKGKLYDESGKEIVNTDVLKKFSYVIFEEEMYEVHTK